MPTLARTGWLGLALASCCALLVLLGILGGRGAWQPRSSPARPERGSAEVRGRAVLPARGAPAPGEAARWPGRRTAEARAPREPQAPRAGAAVGLAALAGRITRDGRGVRAHLRFELGWNQGRELDSAADGTFACSSLGPGFQRVTVTLADRPACTRSLFLEPYREATLELDFGTPSERRVRVLDAEGRALPGAVVELDGEPATTGPDGRARLVSRCSGSPELVVRAVGCAWFACSLGRPGAGPDEELVVRLDPACVLELQLPALAGAGEAVVHLLPRGPERLAGRPLRPATPWYLASPLRLAPGASVRLDHLPAGELELRALHPTARLARERVTLDPRRPLALALRPTAPVSGEARGTGSLAALLSDAGLGGLPRLQPLAGPPSALGAEPSVAGP